MHVDKPRHHTKAGCVDGFLSHENILADCFDCPAVDANIADFVKVCLRVQHTAVQDNDVESSGHDGSGGSSFENMRVDSTALATRAIDVTI